MPTHDDQQDPLLDESPSELPSGERQDAAPIDAVSESEAAAVPVALPPGLVAYVMSFLATG